MAIRRKQKTRRSFAKRRPALRRKAAPKKKSMVKLIKREISKATENKTFQVFNDNYSLFPSNNGPAFDGNIIPVSPYSGAYLNIGQGLGQGQRVGNKIKLKKLNFSGIVYPQGYNATTNLTPAPCQVKLWFFYDKEEPQSIPTPQASADFLQFGSTSLALGNRLFDHMAPVNTDRYRVLCTRTLKVGYAEYGGTGATGSVPVQGNFTNNDFKLNARFNVNLMPYAIKDVVYRDTANAPTTRGIFMMAQPVYANGTGMADTQIPCKMTYFITCEYEDA